MILPGLIVLIAPLFLGIVIHPICVVGLLPGALVSGVQLAISMSNSGGAWDNAKKYIEAKQLEIDPETRVKIYKKPQVEDTNYNELEEDEERKGKIHFYFVLSVILIAFLIKKFIVDR